MSEKELLYIQDIYEHEDFIINKISKLLEKENNNKLLKELLKKHVEIKNSIYSLLEELC